MQLWFIAATNCEDNLDLFVAASAPTEAAKHWLRYYEDWDLPETIRVFHVPRLFNAGAMGWDSLRAVSITVDKI